MIVALFTDENVVAIQTVDSVVEIAAGEEVVAVSAIKSAIDRIRARNRTNTGQSNLFANAIAIV